MRYRIVAVGRVGHGYARDGCERFLKRLRALAPTEIVEVRTARASAAVVVRRQEGEALLSAVTSAQRVVALDERGRTFTTKALAEHVTQLELHGVSRLDVLIGGAEGHTDAVRERAEETWSLSPLTFPHDLARLVLLEQLYRIETLRSGHPYHRD
ncbi:MAG: 23S rRNA (pseudouridine(1915)-N(3))-methyltransferase RlmH [Trueperaceae bacterium]